VERVASYVALLYVAPQTRVGKGRNARRRVEIRSQDLYRVPASALFWSDIGKPRNTEDSRGLGRDMTTSPPESQHTNFLARHPVVYHNTRLLFYLTTLVCHFPPLGRRACGRFVEWVRLVRCTSRHKAFMSLRKHTAAVFILMPSVVTAVCCR
jgi:hypothetical protein